MTKEKYGYYCELRNNNSLLLDEFLYSSIKNYSKNNYEKIINKVDRFKQMMSDFANQELKKILSQETDLGTEEGKKLEKLFRYLSDLVNDQFKNLKKMEIFDKKGKFEDYIQKFYSDLMKKKKCENMESLEQKLTTTYDYEYLITFDQQWKKYFVELVKEYQGIRDSNEEKKEIQMEIKVTFKSKEASIKFNNLCAQIISKLQLIKEKDEKTIQQNPQYEYIKIKTLKIILANFIIFRNTNVQKQFFKSQIQNLLDLSLFTPEIINKEDQSLVTYQQNPYVLLPEDLHIQLKDSNSNSSILVKSMKYALSQEKYDQISYEEKEEFNNQMQNEEQNRFKKLEYFMIYFYFYKEADGEDQLSRYAFVPEQVLDDGVAQMQNSCFGLEGFLQNNQMKSLLEEFKNPLRFYECKGPLIYGPPGTGKTFIIQKMIKNFQIHLIFDGNSSTFQTSLQGQGSRLLTIYFNRARAIPWQPCAAHIGEIEQLVKKKDESGGGSSEVLNKLLELTDGTETVGNVKIFSTTNHVEMIEEAILSRFRQVYLGKSNTLLRRDWIVWYLMQNKNQSEEDFKKIMKGFFSDVENFMKLTPQLQQEKLKVAIEDIVSYTVNFSTRQLKALMSNITSKILFGQLTHKSLPEQKLKFILDFCKSLGEDNFMFGNKSLPQIMFDCSNQKPSEFISLLLKEKRQIQQTYGENGFQIQEDSKFDELNEYEVKQYNDEDYEFSKVVFIDQSACQNEKVNILMQKQRITQKINLYNKVEDMYYLFEILAETTLKLDQIEKELKDQYKFIDKFDQFISSYENQFQRLYEQKKKAKTLPQGILEFLEKILKINQKSNQSVSANKRVNENSKDIEIPEEIKKEVTQFYKDTKKLVQLIYKLMERVREDIKNYENLQSLEQKLIETKQILAKCFKEIDLKKLIKIYKAFIDEQIKKLSEELNKIISLDQLDYMSLKEIVSSKKFYQLQFCSLRDSSYDHILLLLAEFIKRGDFSKVDMVDYHSCERNNAFKDINSFKDYISNLTKEGKEEEKSLIVYKLDEILDVTEAEDEQLEKDKKQMAIKIFQTINVDTANSNMWSVFIAKNQNVIDLFYNTVTYWPKQSIKGKQNQIQQQQLKLVECKICQNIFKECDEEDKCKEHTSNLFFIEKNTEKYKKFEGDWYGKYLEEYYKRQKHANEHKNNFQTNSTSSGNKYIEKGCQYCENQQELKTESYSEVIYELKESSFNKLKSNSIIPPYFNYHQIIELEKPISKEEAKKFIEEKQYYPNYFKRMCCQGDYEKEECNPHKHQKKEDITNENIQEEIQQLIKKKLIEFKK